MNKFYYAFRYTDGTLLGLDDNHVPISTVDIRHALLRPANDDNLRYMKTILLNFQDPAKPIALVMIKLDVMNLKTSF
jgi:hypothetical protein